MNATETNIVNSEPKIASPATNDAKMVNLNEAFVAVNTQAGLDITATADIRSKLIN